MNKISKVYIMRPKNFFFYYLFFLYTKKYNFLLYVLIQIIIIEDQKNFFRKYLSNYVINDRETKKIRPSRKELQLNLVIGIGKKKNRKKI